MLTYRSVSSFATSLPCFSSVFLVVNRENMLYFWAVGLELGFSLWFIVLNKNVGDSLSIGKKLSFLKFLNIIVGEFLNITVGEVCFEYYCWRIFEYYCWRGLF